MKKLLILLAVTMTTCLVTSCGTSLKRTLADNDIPTSYVEIGGVQMVIYIDDHGRTKKNADEIFNAWAESQHLKGNITGKRLMSIAPRQDACLLTYDFRMTAGNQQRIVLLVLDYTKTYRKKHKQVNSAIVNGKKYDFNH